MRPVERRTQKASTAVLAPAVTSRSQIWSKPTVAQTHHPATVGAGSDARFGLTRGERNRPRRDATFRFGRDVHLVLCVLLM
jgi:hypothetical protein